MGAVCVPWALRLSYITGLWTVPDRSPGGKTSGPCAGSGGPTAVQRRGFSTSPPYSRRGRRDQSVLPWAFPWPGAAEGGVPGRHPLLTIPELLLLPFRALWRHRKALGTLFNLAAPVAAAFVLAATVNHWTNLTFALSVEYDGEQVGYITDESVFDNAAVMAEERLSTPTIPLRCSAFQN